MLNIHDNTHLFYEEFDGNCNQEKLLKIARNGIYLYKSLSYFDKTKYHKNTVEINILAGEEFIIYNNKQYNKFKCLYFKKNSLKILFKNCPRPPIHSRFGFSSIDSKEDYLKLIIINEFFIKKFIHDIDYYNDKDSMYKNRNFKFGTKEVEIIICVLIRENNKELLKQLLKNLFKNYNYERDFKFDKYFKYDCNFILKLLLLYKNKMVFSKKDFKLLLIKEKENKSNSIINFNIDNKYFVNFYRFPNPNETTTPLHIACYYAISFSCNDIIKILIQYGANVNIQNNKGITPLMNCQYFENNYSVMKLLIDHNANVNIKDNNGDTVLHKVRKCSYEDNDEILLKYLLNKGANINEVNNKGYTPLMNLIYYHISDNFTLLYIKYGANINKVNKEGDTPLIMACKNESESTAKILIKHGSDVNKADNEGNTPLIISCSKENFISLCGLVTYLIDHGADINKANNKGETPLFLACGWRGKELIEYFLLNGAELNVKNKDGNTPLSYAYLNNNNEAIDYLIKIGAK